VIFRRWLGHRLGIVSGLKEAMHMPSCGLCPFPLEKFIFLIHMENSFLRRKRERWEKTIKKPLAFFLADR